jgi:hypothetical protein
MSLSLIFSSQEGSLDEVSNVRPLSGSIPLGDKFCCYRLYRFGGQTEHLEKGAVKGNEVLIDQAVSGFQIVVYAEPKE